LDNLESFLSTFQKDLAAVAGQISELQDRSKDIDSRLKSRKVQPFVSTTDSCWYLTVLLQKVERPLTNLISDITISPPLAAIILDTNVGDPWINAIIEFERRLVVSKARTRVKAARDLAEVIEGLRIVVSISSLVIILL
jgi:vacuolar protein sorting-associated protein 52